MTDSRTHACNSRRGWTWFEVQNVGSEDLVERGSSARKKGNAGREDQRSRSLLLQNATFYFLEKSGKNQEKEVAMRGKADGFYPKVQDSKDTKKHP
jgi:hypothetical protein